ncbi:hypothetical protein Zm00014a_043775 [Zea mays]|uniref:Uncharacterized protein n=1 Tax=Zea mays TaxID=4577 RepID=A0A3L6FXL4_MAIZE|nr:hypothetical protein Zm00014a_043775 [Zea mays]
MWPRLGAGAAGRRGGRERERERKPLGVWVCSGSFLAPVPFALLLLLPPLAGGWTGLVVLRLLLSEAES